MGVARIEQYAKENGIDLESIGESDGCELSLSYRPGLTFHSLLNGKDKITKIFEIAHAERKYLEILPPSLSDFGIDQSIFHAMKYKYIDKITAENPINCQEATHFNDHLASFVSDKMFSICNAHLKSVKDGKFKDFTLASNYNLYASEELYRKLAANLAEYKEFSQALNESIKLIDDFFSTPSKSLAAAITEAKRLAAKKALLVREKNEYEGKTKEQLLQIGFFSQGSPDHQKALRHAAFARDEDVVALMTLLNVNPKLLLQSGNVITPGGMDVRNVTIYEFLLGAGDSELAKKVGLYFDKIENGPALRAQQYERYRPFIENMLTQPPYDLTCLVNLINQSPEEDVIAALNKDMSHESPLRDALVQFRLDHAPRIIDRPSLHYNYSSLLHACKLLDRHDQWGDLFDSKSWSKRRLMWIQIIGFEMRRLPGVARCEWINGIRRISNESPRAYFTKWGSHIEKYFPLALEDKSSVGLGWDYAISYDGYTNANASSIIDYPVKEYLEQKLRLFNAYAKTIANPVEDAKAITSINEFKL